MSAALDLASSVIALSTRVRVVPERSDEPPTGMAMPRTVSWDEAGDQRIGDIALVVGRDTERPIDNQLAWLVSAGLDRPVLVVHTAPEGEAIPDLGPVYEARGFVIDRSAADSDTGIQVALIHLTARGVVDRSTTIDLRARAALAAENARLRRELRSAEGQVTALERKVDRLESSGVLLVGRTVVDAVRHPRRAGGSVKELYSRWRTSGRRAAVTRKPPATTSELSANGGDLLLAHRAFVPVARQLPTIALIGAPATERLLAPYAHVVSLTPHDAEALLERVLPDLVLIDTRAVEPGGPWSLIGTPSAPDRDVALLAAYSAAVAVGVPVVMWKSTGPEHTAFLEPLAQRVDLVLSQHGTDRDDLWTPGARLLTAPHVGERRGVVVPVCGGVGDRIQLQRAAEVIAAGHEVMVVGGAWGHEPSGPWPSGATVRPGRVARREVLSSAALGVPLPVSEGGGPSLELLELLMCGVRVTGAPAFGAPVAAFAEHPVSEPMSEQDQWQVWRWVFAEHSVPVALDHLMNRLRLPLDALWSRRVSVVSRTPNAPGFVDDLLAQSWPPHEVIVPSMRALDTGVRDHILAAGISVRSAGSDSPLALEEAAMCTLVVSWAEHERWSDDHLARVAVRAEQSAVTGRPMS